MSACLTTESIPSCVGVSGDTPPLGTEYSECFESMRDCQQSIGSHEQVICLGRSSVRTAKGDRHACQQGSLDLCASGQEAQTWHTLKDCWADYPQGKAVTPSKGDQGTGLPAPAPVQQSPKNAKPTVTPPRSSPYYDGAFATPSSFHTEYAPLGDGAYSKPFTENTEGSVFGKAK